MKSVPIRPRVDCSNSRNWAVAGCVDTGVRDDVVCNLRCDWETPVPELSISVFETPPENVKGRRTSKLVVCNSLLQEVVEALRGVHLTHVFVMVGSGHVQFKR